MLPYHWLGIRLHCDWLPIQDEYRLRFRLRSVPRPGWYMLTACYRGEQKRCFGLFHGAQGRVLIDNRLRRRLVRIPAGVKEIVYELHGLNGQLSLPVLRLVPQPFWRARSLLSRKLLRLHPSYAGSANRRPLPILWRDYNHLLSQGNRQLVGYDEWIERCERPALAAELAGTCGRQPEPDDSPGLLRFMPGLWGQAPAGVEASRSLRSLEHQLQGSFVCLDPSRAAEADDAGTWLVFLQSGDQLAPHALRHFLAALRAHPEARVLYADEDRITASGRRHSPQFKPAWNPDLLYSDPHYSHCWLIRADLAHRAAQALDAAGEPVTFYGLVLEATAACQPGRIVHLPEVLYHRADRDDEQRADPQSAMTLARFLARQGQAVSVTVRPAGGHRLHWPLPDPPPLVSVIIPTRDRLELLRRCLNSLEAQAADGPPIELLLIDNDSRDPATLAYLEEVAQRPEVTLIRRPGPFNFAALNNEAADLAQGELLAFLNNDVEALSPGWLYTMAAEALRPDIGAVGARLLFEDGSVQHAGVLLGIGGIAGHAHKYLPGEAAGYQLRLQLTHQVSAVTAAVLVLRRSLFLEIGGFDATSFQVNYNDVDLCLRLMARGYRNLYCADAVLVHHESRSRGAPSSPEAYSQWQRERQAMQRRWGSLLEADPHYSPHLSLTVENFSLALRHGQPITRVGGS